MTVSETLKHPPPPSAKIKKILPPPPKKKKKVILLCGTLETKSSFSGENVTLEGAYIWDGVTVEDNCKVGMCVLDNDVHIKKDVNIESGCILAKGVSKVF